MAPKLYPGPGIQWQQKYDKLMKDRYLSKKYNRTRRIQDKKEIIHKVTPEITHRTGKKILDIGPGPGEFLEWCRQYGHTVKGIDAKITDCEMGNEYIQLSKLMTERQQLDVEYCGFMDFLAREHTAGEYFYIVMQGSIEQCFKEHLKGPPHRETKKSSGLKWMMTPELEADFTRMFEVFDTLLEDGGYIFIWANGSKNNPDYDDLVLRTLEKFPDLQLFKKAGKLQHKIRKMA